MVRVRPDDLVRQAGPAAEIERPGPVRNEAVRPALDEAAFDPVVEDVSSGAARGLQGREPDRQPALAREREEAVGAGQAGDPRAGDDDTEAILDGRGQSTAHARATTSRTRAASMPMKDG